MGSVTFLVHDGGRAEAGFRGEAGDCGVRALALASGLSYRDAYDTLFAFQRAYVARTRMLRGSSASPRDGVWKEVMCEVSRTLGAEWTPLSSVGGPVVRVGDVRLRWPEGRVVMRLARHYSAMIDGVNVDTWEQDPGKRVHGVWVFPRA